MKYRKQLLPACVCLSIMFISGVTTVKAQGERETAVRKAPVVSQRDYSINQRALDEKSVTVNRFIGETEKPLFRTFDRADDSNDWIQSYDEADDLFEKRTVKPDEDDE